MARGVRPAFIAFAALLWAANGGAAPAFPSHEVTIDVSVADNGTATVVERYSSDRPGRRLPFEWVQAPCSDVGPVAATIAGRPLVFDTAHRGPWTTLTAAGEFPPGPIVVRYEVGLAGEQPAIPIVLPAEPLETAPQLRGSDVAVRVVFTGASAARSAIVLPRFDRAGDAGTWQARLLAIPSVVAVRLPGGGAGACGQRLAGSSGGLERRFWIFVMTMAIWVPIYFWWFSRRDEAA